MRKLFMRCHLQDAFTTFPVSDVACLGGSKRNEDDEDRDADHDYQQQIGPSSVH